MSKGTDLAATALTAVYSLTRSHSTWTDPAFLARLRQITPQLSPSAQSHIHKVLSQAELPAYSTLEQYCYGMEVAAGSTVQVFARPNQAESAEVLQSFQLFLVIARQDSPTYLPREGDFLVLP